jgi:hypothetical protein
VKRWLACALVLGLCASGLAGCTETIGSAQTNVAPPTQIAARPGVSPRGASFAVASVDGAPTALTQRFSTELQAAAAARNVTISPPESARYLARIYLNAFPVEGGAAVAIVSDVFDSARRRQQRVEDAIIVKGAAADPWSLVDERSLAAAAGRSAETIAAFLTNTPEAIAAAGAPRPAGAAPLGGTPVADAGGLPASALGYAPLR